MFRPIVLLIKYEIKLGKAQRYHQKEEILLLLLLLLLFIQGILNDKLQYAIYGSNQVCKFSLM